MSTSLVKEFEKIVKSFNTIVFGDDDQDVVVDGITKPTISKIMLGIKSQFNGLKLEMTNLLNSSRDESNIIVSALRDLHDQGVIDITSLEQAIEIAAAAGAGENGWTASLVVDGDKTQKQINDNQKQINDNQKTINLRTITPYDFGAIGGGVDTKVSSWLVVGSNPYYETLEALQVDYPHVTSLNDTVDWAAFQKFLDYVKVNTCDAQANGDFYINKPLNFLRNREPYTRVIKGDITLKTKDSMSHMLRLTGLFTKWIGYINLQAEPTGSLDYQLRKVEHGLILGGFEEGYTSLGISVDEVRVHGVKQLGVFCREWSMFAKIGSVRTSGCGFGAKYDSTRQYANWSDRIDNDLDTFSQRSTIKVDVLPPKLDSDSTILVANINNEPYKIESIDEVNKTISVFPKIDTTLTSGQLYYVGGGAFGVDGANSNCVRVDLLSAVSSGIGCYNRSFYDLQITRFVSEANGIGYAHGKIATQIIITVLISNYYNETDSWLDILNGSRVTTGANINIVSSSGLNEDRFKNVIAYRKSDNTLEGLYGGVGLSSININSRTKTHLKLPDNKTEATVTEYAFEVCDPRQHIYRKNSWVFNLSCTEKLNRLYGWDSTTIELIGTGTNNKPTGDFIFNPPVGWTVNGSPSVTLRSNTSSLRLSLYANFATKNIAIVSNQAVSATKTFNPPSLNANATTALTTVTLSGATVGANVNVSFSQPLGVSARIWGEVTAANTVTVYLQNLTAAALDLPSGDITVKLI